MLRTRKRKENVEKMSQPRITDFFSEKKSKRKSLDNLKDNEQTIKRLKKTVQNNDETKLNETNASKLLISVLKKETKSKANAKKNTLKTITNATNTQETNDLPLKNIEKPKPLIKENIILEEKHKESTVDDIAVKCQENPQQTEIGNSKSEKFKYKKKVQISTPKKLQEKEAVSDVVTATNLPLPKDYEFLLHVFTSIDSVAMMLYKRRSVITFNKLQPALQNMANKKISLEELGKIYTIFPEAFSFKRKEMLQLSDPNKTSYEIILEPKFDNESNLQGENNETVLSVRKKKFYNALLERVKCQHEQFLKETSKSSSVIRKVKINCWHPNFDVEKCKPIEISDLEVFRITKITSPKQVLQKVMETLKTSPEPAQEKTKNISKQVVEQDYYQRLPAVAKIVRCIFVSERKNVLPLSTLVEKVQFSYKVKLTILELEKHIKIICNSVPEWLKCFNLGNCDRVKLDKNIRFEKIQTLLESLAKNK